MIMMMYVGIPKRNYIAFHYLEYFKNLFKVEFSIDPCTKEKEEAAYIFFMDFLQECEGVYDACLCS